MREANIWWLDSTTNEEAKKLRHNYYIVGQKPTGECVFSRFFAPCVLETVWQTTSATVKKGVDEWKNPTLTVHTQNSVYQFSSRNEDVIDYDVLKSLQQYHTCTKGGDTYEIAGCTFLHDKVIVIDFEHIMLQFVYLTHCVGDSGEDGFLDCDMIEVYHDNKELFRIDPVAPFEWFMACKYAQEGTLLSHLKEFGCVYDYTTDSYIDNEEVE